MGGAIAFDEHRPTYQPMPYHRFKVGQTVVVLPAGPHALIPRGPHTVVRLLPLTDSEPHYRIRSAVDGLERVVCENQIRRMEESPTPRTDEVGPSKPGRGRR
jgi:hypothetical protein